MKHTKTLNEISKELGELIKAQNATAEKIKQLSGEIANLKNPTQSEQIDLKPKKDEIYYLINARPIGEFNQVQMAAWNDNEMDRVAYAIGNCFKTEDEAWFMFEKLLVLKELKDYAATYNKEIKWGDMKSPYNYPKYYILYSYTNKKIYVDYFLATKLASIYFSSKEIAERAIEYVGEDRIKKYYLEVNDDE